jgi:hypothetical protein
VVDFNPSGGSVILRGIEVQLDSDIGFGFIDDCCRFTEGVLGEGQIKSKYGLNDSAWARLADNEPLIRAVDRAKERRIHNGDAAREKAQWLFVQAPDVLGSILSDTSMPARNRIEAAKELRQVAENRPESTPASGERFIIKIDLTAGGGEVLEFNKTLMVEPERNERNEEPAGTSDEHEPVR